MDGGDVAWSGPTPAARALALAHEMTDYQKGGALSQPQNVCVILNPAVGEHTHNTHTDVVSPTCLCLETPTPKLGSVFKK